MEAWVSGEGALDWGGCKSSVVAEIVRDATLAHTAPLAVLSAKRVEEDAEAKCWSGVPDWDGCKLSVLMEPV